ncbi:MAG: hypothetical protein Q4C91_20795 [Eubacteriales bacterium]|nr:hypothetical protein [Eubacteriales bacterium]
MSKAYAKLADDLVVTEIYARHYGFEKEMKEFNNHFICDDIDRKPFLFIQAGDSVVTGYSGKQYGCFQYQDAIIHEFKNQKEGQPHIYMYGENKEGKSPAENTGKIFDPAKIPELRRRAAQMRKQEKERVEEEERKEKALYAAPLPDGVIIPSANAGARECDIPTEGETYRSKKVGDIMLGRNAKGVRAHPSA